MRTNAQSSREFDTTIRHESNVHALFDLLRILDAADLPIAG